MKTSTVLELVYYEFNCKSCNTYCNHWLFPVADNLTRAVCGEDWCVVRWLHFFDTCLTILKDTQTLRHFLTKLEVTVKPTTWAWNQKHINTSLWLEFSHFIFWTCQQQVQRFPKIKHDKIDFYSSHPAEDFYRLQKKKTQKI